MGTGNVTPAAEFNIHADPESAQTVFRSATTKTLIPLDVTNQVTTTYDLLSHLPNEETDAGKFLHPMLSFLFRTHRNILGLEGIHLHGAVALVAVLHPELFESEEMAGDVETAGQLTTGATVFDRRNAPMWRPNMEVATEVDATAVTDCILRGLNAANRR